MDNNQLIDAAIIYIKELFRDNADGHDLEHSMRVYKNTLDILPAYPDADELVTKLSAILHDVDDHKLFDTEDNANARSFMEERAVDEAVIERICEAINSVSFSKNKGVRPKTIEGCIVQDADRLDALGAIGVARTFAYGGKHGRSLEDSVSHFYDKLLLLKDQMNTPEAKKMAEERHAFLVEFIAELDSEISD